MEFDMISKFVNEISISVVITFILILLFYIYQLKYFQNVKIPGPATIPILGNLRKFIGSGGNTVDYFLNTTKLYFPTCRFWFGNRLFVAIADATDLEYVMNNSSCLHREKLRQAFEATCMENGLFSVSGTVWSKHRKVINPTFNIQVLVNFVRVFHQKSIKLVENLKCFATGEPFDVLQNITYCTFDIVCETVLGTPMNTQTTKDDTLIKSINDINITITEIIKKPWLGYKLIFNMTKLSSTALKSRKAVSNLIDEIVRQKTEYIDNKKMVEIEDEEERKMSFLNCMVDSVLKGSPKLSSEEIQSEAVTLMLAGLETTAGTISFCLMLLGMYKDIQDKIYEELTDIFGDSFTDIPSYQQLQDMKYTEQVLNEVLRLYPVVPVVPRIVENDIAIQNFVLPTGCTILLNIFAAHRNPKYFSNPEKFDPENFSPENVRKRHSHAFIPFSRGPRMCIGRKFALLQMKTILATLLRSYVVLPGECEKDLKNLDYQVTLRPVNGFIVRLCPRNHNKLMK